MNPVVLLKAALDDGQVHILKGREAFAAHELITAGARGVTPIDNPGPRWSDYVFKLKKRGLVVETRTEAHGGAYAGHHARYILRTPLRIVEVSRRQDRRAA